MNGRFVTETPHRTEEALLAIGMEREAQYSKWGPQHHPDGTDSGADGPYIWARDNARAECENAAAEDRVTWRHILLEEVMEALAEGDPSPLRKELVQVAAVCAAWIEDIDSRGVTA